MEYLNF